MTRFKLGDYRLNFPRFKLNLSHGKGPNNALGGTVKLMVQPLILTRQNIVSDAESFARALVEAGSNTDITVMSSAEIEKGCTGLHMEFWQNLPKFNSTCVSTVSVQ